MSEDRVEIDQAVDDASLAGWEIASVVSSLVIAEWVVLSFLGPSKLVAAIPIGLAFLFMYLSHRLRGETMRDLGFRTDNFLAAARWLFWPTLVAGVVIVLTGWLSGSLRFALLPSRPRFLLLPAWALAQQYVMQGFVNRRAQVFLASGVRSVILVGAIFALLHLPNLPLASTTFVGGLIWAIAYQRVPNLLAPAISHAIVSLLLAFSLPSSWLNSLRVGFKYFG